MSLPSSRPRGARGFAERTMLWRSGLFVVVGLAAWPRAAEARAPRGRAPAAVSPGATSEPIDVRADELKYLPGDGCAAGAGCPARLELVGRVALELGGVRLEAGRAVLQLDRQGQAVSADASQGVRIAFGGRDATAARAKLLFQRRSLALEQDVRLRWGGGITQVRGDRVDIDLARGRVVVQQARVTLNLAGQATGDAPDLGGLGRVGAR